MNNTINMGKKIIPMRAFALIVGLHFVFSTSILLLSAKTDSPFIPWFQDTPALLLTMLASLLLLGLIWDGILIWSGLAVDFFWKFSNRSGAAPLGMEALRTKHFFTCGIVPIGLLLTTAVTLLGTSNITLLNLKLLSQGSQWRDPFMWRLEGGVLEHIAALPINTRVWDSVYHSAWGIEIAAAFALIVISRGGRIVLHYCVTMILVFYIGRLLGVLNPVMGPAFYRPDVFGYLDGSVTAEAMRMVTEVMALTPEQAIHSGGILLGGVSAMPSLHVAMVSVTAYWLARSAPWTAWVTIPWVIFVWSSTVALGWHYISDGAGGIVLGAVCVWSTALLLRILGIEVCTAPRVVTGLSD